MTSINKDLIVALDLMGGDLGPSVSVPAAKRALLISPDLSLILIGDPASCIPLLKKEGLQSHPRVKFIPSESSVSSQDRPGKALRHSRGTSMRLAVEQVASGNAGSCVSAGNTGALMAIATHILSTVEGMERPALASFIPKEGGGKTLLLDLGANVSCTARNLAEFAVMGARKFQAENLSGELPKVALLNVGTEENKGNNVIHETSEHLIKLKCLKYIGYVEGDSLFCSPADVIVCDGFTGNIALKSSEGLVRMIHSLLSRNLRGFWWWLRIPLGLFLRRKLAIIHPDRYNGASLLGLKGVVVKSHGSAGVSATASAILRAQKEALADLPSNFLDIINR